MAADRLADESKVLLLTGRMPACIAAGMFLLIAFLAASWIFRKSFCGWLCPVGTISEYLWRLGRQTFGRNFRLPRRLGYRAAQPQVRPAGTVPVRGRDDVGRRNPGVPGGPYGVVDDVKMLNFFRFLGLTGGIVLAVLVLASVFVQNFWCRYLCPYGALMGSGRWPARCSIRRDTALCIDCGKCAKACPSALPVDRLIRFIGRMHRLPAMRRGVSGGRRAVPGGATGQARSGLGGRRGASRYSPALYATRSGRDTGARTSRPGVFDLVPHANEFVHP